MLTKNRNRKLTDRLKEAFHGVEKEENLNIESLTIGDLVDRFRKRPTAKIKIDDVVECSVNVYDVFATITNDLVFNTQCLELPSAGDVSSYLQTSVIKTWVRQGSKEHYVEKDNKVLVKINDKMYPITSMKYRKGIFKLNLGEEV